MREIEFRFFDTYHKCMVNEGGTVKLDTSDIIDQARRQNYQLMQFTGLRDKNGVKMFEGDIVKWGENIETVSFSDGFFQTETSMIDSCMEVIGNLHQNPELLGESGE